MAYTTPAAVKAAVAPDASTDPSTAASLDDTTLQTCCDKAAAEIDAALGGRYTVPFTDPAPAVIGSIATDIAAWYATLILYRSVPVPSGTGVQLSYAASVALLGQLQAGTSAIEAAGIEIAPVGATVVNPYCGELFTLGDYRLGPWWDWRQPGQWVSGNVPTGGPIGPDPIIDGGTP